MRCYEKGVEKKQIFSQVFWNSQYNGLCVVPGVGGARGVQIELGQEPTLETSWGAGLQKSHC